MCVDIPSTPQQIRQAAYDLDRMFSLREAVTSLDPSGPPQAWMISSEPIQACRRVGILCGSFNPLTLAHSQLAEQVCQTGCS